MVDIELVDDGEEDDDDDEVEVEQGSLQGSWGGSEVEEVEEELVELDPVELLTSLYGNTPRIGAVVVESSGKEAVNILKSVASIYNFGLG